MATISKRKAGQWQAKIRKKNYPTQSRTFSTKASAEQWARMVESEMDRGVFMSTTEAETSTLTSLLAKYSKEVAPTKKSEYDINCRLRTLDRHLGHLILATISSGTIKEYRDYRLEYVSGESVRKEVSLLGRVFKQAMSEWDLYLPRGNPVESLTLPAKSAPRERRLNLGEESRILSAAKQYGGLMPDIIELAIATGIRRGEVTNLKWENVDFKQRTALLVDTKNGTNRRIPLSQKAVSLLKKQRRETSDRIFPIRADSITQAFARIRKIAGIKDIRFHDLRHEATSRFIEHGLGIMEVSAITGHKDLTMLRRYTHLRAEDLAIKLSNVTS